MTEVVTKCYGPGIVFKFKPSLPCLPSQPTMIPSIVHKTGEFLNKTLLPNSPKELATDLDSESLASDKYKSIKAFRTITTMLH